ncbi:MAG: hypothetical protein ACFFC6_15205 [Promethearchaeota archaeon]
MEFKRSKKFPQINEIIDELSEDFPQTRKIVKLLRNLMHSLVDNTTKSDYEEVDWLCHVIWDKYFFSHITGPDRDARYNWELPLELEKILDDCILLHDYPADFVPTPKSILKKLDDYISQEGFEVSY